MRCSACNLPDPYHHTDGCPGNCDCCEDCGGPPGVCNCSEDDYPDWPDDVIQPAVVDVDTRGLL